MVNKHHDPVAVISTNWDILLDNSIKRAIENDSHNGVVDYCCYLSSLHNDKTVQPGLWALGKGKYNVKLLKLHGSMNWFVKCQRLYVAFYNKITNYGIYRINCHDLLCQLQRTKNSFKYFKDDLIMPTFKKT